MKNDIVSGGCTNVPNPGRKTLKTKTILWLLVAVIAAVILAGSLAFSHATDCWPTSGSSATGSAGV